MKQLLSLPFGLLAFLLFFISCAGEPNSGAGVALQDSAEHRLVRAEGKAPMRLISDRPYNLETPLKYFRHDFTPNDVFFVRWHLSELPGAIAKDTFRLRIGGRVARALSLSLEDLKTKFKPYTITALCQCAGNARSCFKPGVAGAQWVNGGMGNARWTGVRVKDLLEEAGLRADARFVSFNGLDGPPLSSVPDFVKSLTTSHAMDGEVMIAYEMNGDTIPRLNGYPLKLVVPGWYATYWVGMLHEVEVLADTFNGYWMRKAYLVPKGVPNGNEQPEALAKEVEPIHKMVVRSIFVSPEPDDTLAAGKPVRVEGLAFDGGDSITRVELSLDRGKTWKPAGLGPFWGRYSWRRWTFILTPQRKGQLELLVRAVNARGATQPLKHWNRSGYGRNEIESLTVRVN